MLGPIKGVRCGDRNMESRGRQLLQGDHGKPLWGGSIGASTGMEVINIKFWFTEDSFCP